ncbi:MAG: exodeoxyribonuclease III [Candidatus Cloacimonadota bacterium]|nr:MAG: exodeoxyribonuclease III [Candidatus Cloacimonadota bacterium]PIE81420.1 MAG: exodeoxyribonuclease III [Candidatus Delongbacteria bacterium]
MKICSWNVNGLRAVMKKGFLDWVKEYDPDILCLQETKLQDENLDDSMRNIEGYKSYWSFAEKKGYSGTVIYTKEEPISIYHGFGVDEFDSEGRIVRVDFKEFILINIYFPNGQSSDERLDYKMRFYDKFLEYSNEIVKSGKQLIVCGDYNTAHNEIDLKNPKSNAKRSGFLPIEREWIDKYISNGYVDTFRALNPEEVKYSWWSYRFNARKNNAGWRIDYFFVNENFFSEVKTASILNDVMGSDHCPIEIVLN